MKKWNELTKIGKFQRLNKAVSKYEGNSNNCLDRFYTEFNGYLDTKDEEYLHDARKEMQIANEYRGYGNHCPILEIEELLS